MILVVQICTIVIAVVMVLGAPVYIGKMHQVVTDHTRLIDVLLDRVTAVEEQKVEIVGNTKRIEDHAVRVRALEADGVKIKMEITNRIGRIEEGQKAVLSEIKRLADAQEVMMREGCMLVKEHRA